MKYIMHMIFNAFITYQTYDAMIASVYDPPYLHSIESSHILEHIIGFHLYDTILYYKIFKLYDWRHHILTILMCIPLYVWEVHGIGHMFAFGTVGLFNMLHMVFILLFKYEFISIDTRILCHYYNEIWLSSTVAAYVLFYFICFYFNGHTDFGNIPTPIIFILGIFYVCNINFNILHIVIVKLICVGI